MVAGCSEPCLIPMESGGSGTIQLKRGSLITYEATVTDSNVRVFQRPPWTERVLTFAASIGDRDSVLATESTEDLTLRFQDIDASIFYQYLPIGPEQDVMKGGFWLKLPLTKDTLVQKVVQTSDAGNLVTITYKSFVIGDTLQRIDGRVHAVKQVRTEYSWDEIENAQIVHHAWRISTNVITSLGLFSEQTLTHGDGRPRSHIIVTKIEP